MLMLCSALAGVSRYQWQFEGYLAFLCMMGTLPYHVLQFIWKTSKVSTVAIHGWCRASGRLKQAQGLDPDSMN